MEFDDIDTYEFKNVCLPCRVKLSNAIYATLEEINPEINSLDWCNKILILWGGKLKDIVLGMTITRCKNEIGDMAGNMQYAEKERLLSVCYVFLEEYEKMVLNTRYGAPLQEPKE